MSKIFSFNEAGLGSYQDSVSGTLGTNSNGVFKKTEKGYAWKGDGTSTYIILDSSMNLGTTHTIISWANPVSQAILGNSADSFYALRFVSNSLFYRTDQGTAKSVAYTLDGLWHQYAIVRNGDNIEFFVDGESVGTDTGLGSDTLTINRIGRFSTQEYDGLIGNIVIDSDIYIAAQIKKDYKDFLRNKGTGSNNINLKDYPNKPDYIREDGLVAAYTFKKDYTGDVSGNHNHGTNNGAMSTKNGMAFDFIKSFIDLGNVPDLAFDRLDSFTFAARIITNEVGTGHAIIGKETGTGNFTGYLFEINTDTKLRLTLRQDGSPSNQLQVGGSTVLQVGVPYSVIVTYNGSSDVSGVNIYMNAVRETPNNVVNTLTNSIINANKVAIGSRQGNTAQTLFDGEIDDVRIYNKVKDLSFIKQYHNQFVKIVVDEDFQNKPVDVFPREWIKDSGIHLVYEDTTDNRWLQCDTNGIAKILYKDTLLGTASIDYYNGATWTTVTDTLENLISTYSWLSHDGTYLKFTLTSEQKIDNIIISNGIKQ